MANPIARTVMISIIAQLSVFSPKSVNAQSYEPPEHFVSACIILSPAVTFLQVSGATKLSGLANNGVSKQFKTMRSLLNFLKNGPLTPQKCRDLLPDTEAEYEEYHFRRDLRRCDEIQREDLDRWLAGAETFDGVSFCDTGRKDQWRRFRDFVLAEENGEAAKAWEEISGAPLFEPLPEFNISKYFGQPSDEYEACKEDAEANGAAAEFRACVIDETERHDRVLNSAYQCLRDTLPEDEFGPILLAQREWLDQTESKCAYAGQDGTLVHDMRAGCWHEAKRTSAADLALKAVRAGCPYLDINTIEPDLDKWWNVDGDPSVSNRDGVQIKVHCDGTALGRITSKDQRDISQFSMSEPLNFTVLDRRGEVLVIVGLRSDKYDGVIDFPVTEYLLEKLSAGSSLVVTDGVHEAVFSLSGSSRALSGCNLVRPPEPEAVRTTSTGAGNSPSGAYANPRSGTFIRFDGQLPVSIRCDRAFPEVYLEPGSVLRSVFGRDVQPGDRFAFELFNRGGRRPTVVPAEAEQISNGVGFPISLYALSEMKHHTNLAIVGLGRDYTIPLSPFVREIEQCQRSSFTNLRALLLGSWRWHNGGNTKMVFTTEPVGTIAGRAERFVFFDNSGQRNRGDLNWLLHDSGQISFNINSNACLVDYHKAGIYLKSGFNCTLQGVWRKSE
ncbi:lysozyme inhibitor LprI family protein [Aliiroseovarius sp.]|uniref:lysozyme inhibitor LprI family protein n=1 Tax=Aliiroseovarius sp. TaxID=1872442 RepID=UPI003BAD784E